MSSLGRLKVVMQTNKTNTATVLFLHGSGDTGPAIYKWVEILIGDFSFPHIKFLFPTAPLRPYTANNGKVTRIWFDRYSTSPDAKEHMETLESAGEHIKKMVHKETTNGVALNRIIVGGFSMGGALALHTAYRFLPGLGGVFSLSAFLNDNSAVYQKLMEPSASSVVATPLFMCHGDNDRTVPIKWGKTTFEKLVKLNVKGDFVPLRSAEHELTKKEIKRLFKWISTVIPPK